MAIALVSQLASANDRLNCVGLMATAASATGSRESSIHIATTQNDSAYAPSGAGHRKVRTMTPVLIVEDTAKLLGGLSCELEIHLADTGSRIDREPSEVRRQEQRHEGPHRTVRVPHGQQG